MPVKPATRAELIATVADTDLHRYDRDIAAAALLRNFPSVLRTFCDLVAMVTEQHPLTPELFDILADSYDHARPRS
jgi:hypothetical protein